MNRKKIARPLYNQLGLVLVFCLASITAMSQVKISGKVTGADGKALPYISVVVKNTTFGSSTDLDGNYSFLCRSESRTICIGVHWSGTSKQKNNLLALAVRALTLLI